MSEPHEKPGVAFWATVFVVAAGFYVVSFVAVCIIGKFDHDNLMPTWLIGGLEIVYAPIFWTLSSLGL